jgi:hypothetical protein
MPDCDTPKPWHIADGPTRLQQKIIDGQAWVCTLERDGAERSLIVAVSGQALNLGAVETLPVQTREAIATDGRSEAARIAQLDDDAGCVVFGRFGYLPAPARLLRLARQ